MLSCFEVKDLWDKAMRGFFGVAARSRTRYLINLRTATGSALQRLSNLLKAWEYFGIFFGGDF